MKDSELRGLVLQRFYDRRRESYIFLQPEEFGLRAGDSAWEDILRICEQLGQQGLIDWRSQNIIGERFSNGAGKITSQGVDLVERVEQSSDRSTITYDNRQYIFDHSSGNIIGDNNIQIAAPNGDV